jgi:hypothetical protein
MESEKDSDIVRVFNVRLCYCLTGIARTCALIRKHKENLQTSGDFSFPIQLEYWLSSVPFVSNCAATNQKTILEYSYLNRVQSAESDTACDGEEWVRQKINGSRVPHSTRKIIILEFILMPYRWTIQGI